MNNPKFHVIVAIVTMSVMTFCGCGNSEKDNSSPSSSKAAAWRFSEPADANAYKSTGGLFGGTETAMLKSNLTVGAAQGRRLCEALIAESIEGSDIWPHLTEKDGLVTGERDEVFGNVYASSTEYFKKLFDIGRQTSAEWKPYVDNQLIECVWGNGATPAPPGHLRPENVGWIVVAGASGLDHIPAFVSANVNPDMLIAKGTVDTAKDNRPIPLGKANGAPMDLYRNKGAVVVYKDGTARTFMAEEFTIRNVYNKRVVRIPDWVTLKYLKP